MRSFPILERNLRIWGRATPPWRAAASIFLLQIVMIGTAGGMYGVIHNFAGASNAALLMMHSGMPQIGLGFPYVLLAGLYVIASWMTCTAGVMVVLERDQRTWESVASSPLDPARFVAEGILSGILRGGAVIAAFLPVISIILYPWMRGPSDVLVVAVLAASGICVTAAASFYAAIVYDPADPYWQKVLSRGGKLISQNATAHVFGWGVFFNVLPLIVAAPMLAEHFRSEIPPGAVTMLPFSILNPLIAVWTRLNLHEPGILLFGRPRPEWMVVLCVQGIMSGLLIMHSILRLRRVRDDRSILHRAMILVESFGVPLALAAFAWPAANWPRLADARNAAGVSVEIVALAVAVAAGHVIVRGGLRRKWWASSVEEPIFRQRAENAHRFAPLVALVTLPALLCALRLQGMGGRGFGMIAALVLATVCAESSWQQVRRRFAEGIPGRVVSAVNTAYVWAIWIAPLLVVGAFQNLEEPRRWLYLLAIWPPFAPVVLLLDLCSSALNTPSAVGMGEKALFLATGIQVVRWAASRVIIALARNRAPVAGSGRT